MLRVCSVHVVTLSFVLFAVRLLRALFRVPLFCSSVALMPAICCFARFPRCRFARLLLPRCCVRLFCLRLFRTDAAFTDFARLLMLFAIAVHLLPFRITGTHLFVTLFANDYVALRCISRCRYCALPRWYCLPVTHYERDCHC